MRSALGRAVGDVKLRVRTPRGSAVTLVQQVAPTIEDLTRSGRARRRADGRLPDRRVGRRAAGLPPAHRRPARCPGRRDAGGTGEPGGRRRGTVSVTDPGGVDRRRGLVDRGSIPRSLTTRARPSWRRPSRTGLEARRAGDDASATSQLGRAAQLAAESGNDGTLRLLAAVVDIDRCDGRDGQAQARRRRGRRDGARHPLHEDGAREAGVNDADPDDPDEDGGAESPSGTELLASGVGSPPPSRLSRLLRAPPRRGSLLRTLRLRPRRRSSTAGGAVGRRGRWPTGSSTTASRPTVSCSRRAVTPSSSPSMAPSC